MSDVVTHLRAFVAGYARALWGESAGSLWSNDCLFSDGGGGVVNYVVGLRHACPVYVAADNEGAVSLHRAAKYILQEIAAHGQEMIERTPAEHSQERLYDVEYTVDRVFARGTLLGAALGAGPARIVATSDRTVSVGEEEAANAQA